MGWRGELVGLKLWRFARGECALRLGTDPRGPAVLLEDREANEQDLAPTLAEPSIHPDLKPLKKPTRRGGRRRSRAAAPLEV
jgi:hypothetical protein